MKIQLGAVWHFSLAVRDPAKSAQFWTKNFLCRKCSGPMRPSR
jgi:hypothetical protein